MQYPIPKTPSAAVPTIAGMDRTDAISELPTSYAVAIRLRDEGADDGTIAAALAIDPGDVPSVLELAEAKLAVLEEGG